MSTRYIWDKYNVILPAMPAWSSQAGDLGFGGNTTTRPVSKITAIRGCELFLGSYYTSGWHGSLFWMATSNQIVKTFDHSGTSYYSCAEYPDLAAPEWAIDGGLIGWNLAHADSGYWKIVNSDSGYQAYHCSNTSGTYSSYKYATVPNVSKCTKGTTLLGEVYSTNPNEYPQDGIKFEEKWPVSTDEHYWYVFKESVLITHTVSLSASPSGGGSVTGSGTFEEGTNVTVRAVPNDAYTFAEWREDSQTVSSSASYTFKLTSDRKLTAVFSKKPVISVSAVPAKGGSVSGGGPFTSGSYATVQAVPADGYEFIGWEENGKTVSTSLSYRFVVTSSRTLIARFKQKLALWVGVSGKARKGVELYVGVNGKARKVTGAWVGVNGKARRFL